MSKAKLWLKTIIITVTVLCFVSLFGCNKDEKNSKIEDGEIPDIGKFGKSIGDKKVKEVEDDGSWVAIVEGELYSVKDFEKDYDIFLSYSVSADEQALVRKNLDYKKQILDQLIMIRILFKKGTEKLEEFKGDSGNKFRKIFSWLALTQYYLLNKWNNL
jgi:hypothetical protein